ncbi:MAG: hypothetical protein M3R15_20175 [Acidobacteriota bacterium]|nr:hypothetical protein [Acidobacteriota bacterium]
MNEQMTSDRIIFLSGGLEYRGASAVEILHALERDAGGPRYEGASLRNFLQWSLAQLSDEIPPRELDLSNTLDDETLAFDYLCLCDEYGIGGLEIAEQESDAGQLHPETSLG